jgi:hypothetical protein
MLPLAGGFREALYAQNLQRKTKFSQPLPHLPPMQQILLLLKETMSTQHITINIALTIVITDT